VKRRGEQGPLRGHRWTRKTTVGWECKTLWKKHTLHLEKTHTNKLGKEERAARMTFFRQFCVSDWGNRGWVELKRTKINECLLSQDVPQPTQESQQIRDQAKRVDPQKENKIVRHNTK